MATYLFDDDKNLVDIDSDVNKYGFDEVKNKVSLNSSSDVYGIDEYKNMVEIGTPVTVPMALSDGSVLFYDRGTQYGEYKIINGNIIRMSEGIDDGSAESTYWRYLICGQHDLDNGRFQWGPYANEGMTDTKYEDMGYGLPNTNAMIAKYATNTSYWWRLIKEKRDNTSLDWFMPSKDELDMMYDNRTVITGQGGDAFKTDSYYWSSSEGGNYYAWYQNFSNGYQADYDKHALLRCRLLRRI